MHISRNNSLAALLVSVAAGCSLMLDLETAQCSTTSDCLNKGPAFANSVCVNHSCQKGQSSLGSAQNDAGSNLGESGRNSAGSAGSGTSAAVGGAGGQAATGCTSNVKCVSENLDEPYTCKSQGEACVALRSPECPIVFGDYNNDNAVYFGAFLNLPASSPLSQMSTLNVQLAVDEFNGSVGGLPGGPLGKLRPLVAVVCRNDPNLIAAGAQHLIENVGVSAVLSHLPSGDLKTFFVNHALPKKVFVLNPGFADNSLTSLSNEGLFWHVIGDVRDVGPAYAPLVSRIEKFVPRSSDKPLRVAMIVAKRFAEQSIAATITSTLRFNSKSVVDNGSNFFTTSVPALADEPSADYSATTSDLLAFRPHVVIALTREEFVYKILPPLESGWNVSSGQERPFYVVPTALSGNLDLLNYIAETTSTITSENKRQRFVGVAPASADDLTLYNDFLVRFRTAYPRFQNPGGFENFYDATYLLANAMFAAGSVPKLTGPDIARGMQRIVTGTATVDIGPTQIADGFAALAAGGNIRFNGTMGPADFDPGVGARRGNSSVYCYTRSGGSVSITYDVLRYRAADKQLHGEFACFPNF